MHTEYQKKQQYPDKECNVANNRYYILCRHMQKRQESKKNVAPPELLVAPALPELASVPDDEAIVPDDPLAAPPAVPPTVPPAVPPAISPDIPLALPPVVPPVVPLAVPPARINKKKNFEAKLRKIPVRKTTMETSARSNVIAATTTDTLTRGSTGFIGSNTGRVSIASKFWTDRSGKNTTNTNEYDDNNDSDETVDLDLEIEPEPEQSSHRVVIVDDSKAYTARLKRLIQRVLFGTSVEIVAFSNIQQATTYLSSSIATLVFMDNIFPSNTTGLEASPNTKSCTKFACIACAQ